MEIQYRATVFLPNHETCPVAEITSRLIECLQAVHPDRISVNEWPGAAYGDNSTNSPGDVLTAFWNDWGLHIYLAAAPHVAEELQEWARSKNFEAPFDVIAECSRRVELWTDEDPDMMFFNDYISLLQTIGSCFEGAVLIGDDGHRT